jgi:hypothetical protein
MKKQGEYMEAQQPRDGEPTAERLRHAESGHTSGDIRGRRIYAIQSPLERAARRGDITPKQFDALTKFVHHWYHGRVAETVSSVDLNRIFASDPSNFSHMPKTERQSFHRKRWREAIDVMSHQTGIVVESVALRENTLELSGYCIGYASKPKAIAGALAKLREGADQLVRLWGL